MAISVSSPTKQVLNTAAAALDDLLDLELSWRQPGDQISSIQAAVRLRAQLDAFLCEVTSEADRTGTAKDAGYRTVAQMVGDRTGADPKLTRADVRLGRWLSEFTEFADAFKNALILREHLELIRRSVDGARTHEQLRREQGQFIEWARDYDFGDFEKICIYWKNAVDPDGAEPKDQIKATSFRARKQADGTVDLKGRLDPLTGAAFMTAFEHEDQKLFRAAQDEGAEPDSVGKRGANALMGLVTRGFARNDGSHPVPLINVVASEAVIEDLIERIDEPSVEPLPVSFDDIDKRCELIDGTPLHPTFLLATLGVATFRRQILNATGRTVDVSLNSRGFSDWQKQALRVEARGRCQTKGCDAPFPWLEADHTHPHSRGGPTALWNGKMKCGPDNRSKGSTPCSAAAFNGARPDGPRKLDPAPEKPAA